MNLTAGFPAWTLRATILLATGLIMVLLVAQGVSPLPAGAVGLLGLLSALAPATPAPALVIIATAVLAAVAAGDSLGPGVFALLPLVHVVHIGAALAAVIPGTGRVHIAALRPVAVRFALVQALAFALAAVAVLVPKAVTPPVLELAALLGAAVLALLATRLIMKRPQ